MQVSRGVRVAQRTLSTYTRSDRYAVRAQQENLRTRAAYKLEEINHKFNNFLCRGANVVDLGASPGGFSLIAARSINIEPVKRWDFHEGSGPLIAELKRTLVGRKRRHGKLVCVDLCEMESIEGATFIKGDIRDASTRLNIIRALGGEEADVVVSDVAPSTTGDVGTNHVRSMELATDAATVARGLLRNGGTLCVKVFQGGDEGEFKRGLEGEFVRVKAFRPAACRRGSREVYYVASGFVPADLISGSCDAVYDEIRGTTKKTSCFHLTVRKGCCVSVVLSQSMTMPAPVGTPVDAAFGAAVLAIGAAALVLMGNGFDVGRSERRKTRDKMGLIDAPSARRARDDRGRPTKGGDERE